MKTSHEHTLFLYSKRLLVMVSKLYNITHDLAATNHVMRRTFGAGTAVKRAALAGVRGG